MACSQGDEARGQLHPLPGAPHALEPRQFHSERRLRPGLSGLESPPGCVWFPVMQGPLVRTLTFPSALASGSESSSRAL